MYMHLQNDKADALGYCTEIYTNMWMYELTIFEFCCYIGLSDLLFMNFTILVLSAILTEGSFPQAQKLSICLYPELNPSNLIHYNPNPSGPD